MDQGSIQQKQVEMLPNRTGIYPTTTGGDAS